jgi:hypothetical protein
MVISLSLFDHTHLFRFFDYLENCGGCTDLRDQSKCRYALLCAHLEKLSKEENEYADRAGHFESKV